MRYLAELTCVLLFARVVLQRGLRFGEDAVQSNKGCMLRCEPDVNHCYIIKKKVNKGFASCIGEDGKLAPEPSCKTDDAGWTGKEHNNIFAKIPRRLSCVVYLKLPVTHGVPKDNLIWSRVQSQA